MTFSSRHNSIKQDLKSVERRLERTKTQDGLVRLVRNVFLEGKKLNHGLGVYHAIAGIGMVLVLILSMVLVLFEGRGVMHSQHLRDLIASNEAYNTAFMRSVADMPWLYIAIIFSIAMGAGMMSAIRRGRIAQLSQKILWRYFSIKYDLILSEPLPKRLEEFADIKYRGRVITDYKRTFESKGKGRYKGSQHTLEYYVCRLGYHNIAALENRYSRIGEQIQKVKKDKELQKARKDQKIQEVSSYDSGISRYFIFVKFPWIKGVSLRSDKLDKVDLTVEGDTAFKEFNEKFKLTGESKMRCARFAKATTLLQMLKFADLLENPNFMFGRNGWLCIGFDNKDIFTADVQVDIDKPISFYKMIKEGNLMSKMLDLLNLIHELAEQHDDNFSLNPHNIE